MNIIETMKQALETLEDAQGNINPERGYCDEIERDLKTAADNLRAAIYAAEKQEPAGVSEEWLPYEQASDQDRHAFPVFRHPAPTQPDSEQAKIGCVGHDGDCCKDREQVYLDADRYRWLRSNWTRIISHMASPVEIEFEIREVHWGALRGDVIDAAIDAAMKVGADGTGEKT